MLAVYFFGVTEYTLEWEEMVWVLRRRGSRVQAFRGREDGVRYLTELAKTGSKDLALTIRSSLDTEVLRFPAGKCGVAPHQ